MSVPLVSPPQGEWKGHWRSSWAALGVEQCGIQRSTKSNKRSNFDRNDKRSVLHSLRHSLQMTVKGCEGADKMWISSTTLGTLAGVTYFHQCQWANMLLMAPQVVGQHKTAAHQRGLQQVCTTCQPCPDPTNMKHSCVGHGKFMAQSPQCQIRSLEK